MMTTPQTDPPAPGIVLHVTAGRDTLEVLAALDHATLRVGSDLEVHVETSASVNVHRFTRSTDGATERTSWILYHDCECPR